MNRQKLTELINYPEKVSKRDTALLRDMAEQYPYATVIQILLAKSKQQQPDARQALATAALYSPNRQVLRSVMEETLPNLSNTETVPYTFRLTEDDVASDAATSFHSDAQDSDQIPSATGSYAEETVHHPTPPEPDSSSFSSTSAPEETPVEEAFHYHTGKPQPEPIPEEEQAKPADSSIFDELEQNLKSLREERNKWKTADDDKQKQEELSKANSKDNTPSPSQPTLAHMPPAIQQVVEEHQQQSLENPRVRQQRALINSFLQNAPSLQRKQAQAAGTEEEPTDLSANAGFTPQDLATETLALIMERQGKTAKAIDIYQKLLLKYPQKSVYFANCIERLKKDL